MKIYDKNNNELFDVLITKDAVHEEELMKSDFVKLSWRDTTQRTIPVDAYIIPFPEKTDIITGEPIKFSLLDPYAPEQKSDAEWLYEPQFQHPKMYLSKVLFELPSTDTQGNDISYVDWPFTGSVSTILTKMVEIINKTFNLTGDDTFGYSFIDFIDKVITVNFSSNDILSALTAVANACEVEWHIDYGMRTIFFGRISYGNNVDYTPPLLQAGENIGISSTRNDKTGYWNAYRPQGSKRNIMRRAATQEFIMSEVRLALDKEKYPEGIMYLDPNGNYEYEDAEGNKLPISKEMFDGYGERMFLKPLIFEEVYPKTDLYVYDVRYRELYKLDADTKKKIVAYTDSDGEHYLKYAVWYFKLARPILNVDGTVESWMPYSLSESVYFYFRYQGRLNTQADSMFLLTTLRESQLTTKSTKRYATKVKVKSTTFNAEYYRKVALLADKHPYGGIQVTGHTDFDNNEVRWAYPALYNTSWSETIEYTGYIDYKWENAQGEEEEDSADFKYTVTWELVEPEDTPYEVTIKMGEKYIDALYFGLSIYDKDGLLIEKSQLSKLRGEANRTKAQLVSGINRKNFVKTEDATHNPAVNEEVDIFYRQNSEVVIDAITGKVKINREIETRVYNFLNTPTDYELYREVTDEETYFEDELQIFNDDWNYDHEEEGLEARNMRFADTFDVNEYVGKRIVEEKEWAGEETYYSEPVSIPVVFDVYTTDGTLVEKDKTGTLETTVQWYITTETRYPYTLRKDGVIYDAYYSTRGYTIILDNDVETVKTAFETSTNNKFTTVTGYGTPESGVPYKVSQIIDGTEAIAAFQPNTYKTDERDAESTPLAGLGGGDGDGHYGFKVRFLGLADIDLDKINKKDTDAEDTGIMYDPDHPSAADEMDFEVVYEQDGANVIPSLPSQYIIPKGDSQDPKHPSLFANKVNIYNVVIDEDAEKAASVDLENETKKYIGEQKKDYNSYTFKSNPVAFHKSNPHLFIGQKVQYKELTDDPAKDCRVQKLITHLDFEFEQEITVGNAILKGATQQLKDEVNGILNGSMTVGSGNGNASTATLATLIKNYADSFLLSKVIDDTAQGIITFVKGIYFGTIGRYFIKSDGDAKLHDLEITNEKVSGNLDVYGEEAVDDIHSRDYTGSGIGDSGWGITSDNGQGNSQAVFDYLVIRKKTIATSLEIKETLFSAGDIAQTLASATIARTDYYYDDGNGTKTLLGYSYVKSPWLLNGSPVILGNEEGEQRDLAHESYIRITLTPEQLALCNRVRCYFLAKDGEKEIENWFRPDDLALCQTWNVTQQKRETYVPGETDHAGNVYWWRKIVDVSYNTGTPRYVLADNDGNPTNETTTDISKAYINEGGVARYAQNGIYSNSGDHAPVEIDNNTYHWFDVAYGFNEEQAGTADWCAALSDLPAAGDKVVQFGNNTDPDRMNVILSEVNGLGNLDAPDIKMLRGVYTFDLSKCWWGGNTCKFKFSPSTGVKVYAPLFEWITEYGIARQALDREEKFWTSIQLQRDDDTKTINNYPDYPDDIKDENGNFVSRANGQPKNYVRKCYYYDRVSHNGSLWLCSLANDAMHWRATSSFIYNGVTYDAGDTVANYKALPENLKALCEHVRNYTFDVPTSASNNWSNQVEKGEPGTFMSRIFCRSNATPLAPSNTIGNGYNIYTNPIPPQVAGQPTWTDGIPEGDAKVWTSTAWFNSDGTHSNWTTPVVDSDTATIDIEYSPDNTRPSEDPYGTTPNGEDNRTRRNAQHWYDPANLPSGISLSNMIWRAERQIANGEYVGGWVVTRIIGENAVRIDLSNENDSMLYDNRGNKLSGDIVTTAYLYDGAGNVSNDTTWSVSSSGCTLDSNTSLPNVKVTALTADEAHVTITGQYTDAHGISYTRSAVLSIKKLVNQDKYDLVISPNALFLNESEQWTADSSGNRQKTVSVKVWRTPANGDTPSEVNPSDYGLAITASVGTLSGSTLTVTQQQAKVNENSIVTLHKSGDTSKVYDTESIPFNKASNGSSVTKSLEVKTYQVGTSGTVAPTGEWRDEDHKPTPAQGQYLWTKTVITWSDNSTTTLYNVDRNPEDGIPGMNVVIDSQSVTYAKTSSSARPEDSAFGDYPTTLSKGDWLHSKTTVNYKYSNGTSAGSTTSYDVSYIGTDGDNGESFGGITEHYKASASSTGESTPSGTNPTDWGTNPMPSDWNKDKKYLWNYEKIEKKDKNGTSSYERTNASVIAVWTENGKGVDAITNFYKKSNADSGVGYPASDPDGKGTAHSGGTATGWSSAVQAPDATNQYLWNYERITWLEPDGSTKSYTYTDPHIIGHFGKNGESAIRIDIDNEMDSIPCDSEGVVMAATTLTTKAKIYVGASPATSEVEVKSVESIAGITASTPINNGEVTISWAIPKTVNNSANVLSAEKYVAQIILTYKQVDYTAVFTANVVKSGEAGKSPIIYQLLPTPSSLAFHRNAAGAITDATKKLTVEIKVSQGNDTGTKTIAQSGLTVRYSTTGTPTTSDTALTDSGVDIANTVSNVYLALFDSSGKVLDKETVPIVVDGAKGSSITKDGADTYRYAVSASSTTTPSTWYDTKQAAINAYNQANGISGTAWAKNTFMWTETTVHWSDGSSTVMYSSERNPNDGVAGQDIIVDGATEIKYSCKNSNTLDPSTISDWANYNQVTQTNGWYLWSKATTWYRKAGSAANSHDAGSSVVYNVSYIPNDGNTPDDARGIVSITEYYKASTKDGSTGNKETAPNDDSGWQTDPNVNTWGENARYLWNYEKIEYSKGTIFERTTPQIVAIWTKDGDSGRGIDSIVNKYCVTNNNQTPAKEGETGAPTWYNTPQAPAQGQYLWNYEVITWTKGTPNPTTTDVQMIGYAGADSTVPGPAGVNVIASPAALIIQQSYDNPANIASGLTEKVYFKVMKGTTEITPSSVAIASIEKFSGTQTNKFTASGSSSNYFTLTGVNANNNAYAENGYVEVTITYSDNGSKTITYRVNVAVNLVGTFKEKIIGDTKTEIANSKMFKLDANGNIVESDYLGEYIRSSKENISRLTAETSENIMPQTSGWQDYEGNELTYRSDKEIYDSSGDIYSPVLLLAPNTTYKFVARFDYNNNPISNSVYAFAPMDTEYTKNSDIYNNGTTYGPTWNNDDDEYSFEFTTSSAVLFIFNYFYGNQQSIFNPQLFKKDNIYSEIKQTADSINASVQDNARNITAVDIKADSISSEVKGIKNGKNLFSGVLTGSGWKSCEWLPTSSSTPEYHDITVDENGNLIRANNDPYLVSPTFKLKQGKEYTLSFTGGGSFMVYVKNVSIGNVTDILSNHKEGGGRFSINFTSSGNYNAARAFFGINISEPQIETGSEATAFEASDTEIKSQIKQTADNIQLFVTNGLNNTGIDIANGTIELRANKVTFQNSAGTLANPKIWIDPKEGTLNAENANITGRFEGSKGRVVISDTQNVQGEMAQIFMKDKVTVNGTEKEISTAGIGSSKIGSGSNYRYQGNLNLYGYPENSDRPSGYIKMVAGDGGSYGVSEILTGDNVSGKYADIDGDAGKIEVSDKFAVYGEDGLTRTVTISGKTLRFAGGILVEII